MDYDSERLAAGLATLSLLILAIGCDPGSGGGEAGPAAAGVSMTSSSGGSEQPSEGDSTGDTEDTPGTDGPDEAGEGEGDSDDGESDGPRPTCDEHSTCFSWCGPRFRDESCHEANDVELDAEEFGRELCDPVVLELANGEVRLDEDRTDDDLRCFLQVLRYGHVGVAELHWNDAAAGRSGHLVVQGLGRQFARIEMRVDGVEPDCGDVLALSAPRAHVLDRYDLRFNTCLDDVEQVDAVQCVLGPAATFYEGHDWVYDVAFPWLSGACGVD